jgi:hypothetical protein
MKNENNGVDERIILLKYLMRNVLFLIKLNDYKRNEKSHLDLNYNYYYV